VCLFSIFELYISRRCGVIRFMWGKFLCNEKPLFCSHEFALVAAVSKLKSVMLAIILFTLRIPKALLSSHARIIVSSETTDTREKMADSHAQRHLTKPSLSFPQLLFPAHI
jgi:hypothetical protein